MTDFSRSNTNKSPVAHTGQIVEPRYGKWEITFQAFEAFKHPHVCGTGDPATLRFLLSLAADVPWLLVEKGGVSPHHAIESGRIWICAGVSLRFSTRCQGREKRETDIGVHPANSHSVYRPRSPLWSVAGPGTSLFFASQGLTFHSDPCLTFHRPSNSL